LGVWLACVCVAICQPMKEAAASHGVGALHHVLANRGEMDLASTESPGGLPLLLPSFSLRVRLLDRTPQAAA
jgi:hypothetical protein